MDHEELEEKARTLAALYGGKIISNGETRAFQVGRREGWWQNERGYLNADCVDTFVDRHWQEFISEAREEEDLCGVLELVELAAKRAADAVYDFSARAPFLVFAATLHEIILSHQNDK
jgi:hypothetical protein